MRIPKDFRILRLILTFVYSRLNAVFSIGFWLLGSIAFASSGITYHGKILKPDGLTPVTSSTTQFRIQIRTPGVGNCLLWEEQQTKDLSTTAGVFTITIADTAEPTLIANTLPFTLEATFSNRKNFTGLTGCSAGTTFNPNSFDGRSLVVFFKETPTDPWEQMPVTNINFVPLALNSVQLEGYAADEFLKIDPLSTYTPLTSANVTTLMDIIAGTSNQYLKPTSAFAGDVTGTSSTTVVEKIRGTNVVSTAPAAGQVLKFDGTNWAPAADNTGGTPGDASYTAKGVVQINTDLATSGLFVAGGVLALPNLITPASSVGGAQAIPVISYDQKGRLTTVTTSTVDDTTKLPLAGGTMTGNINMGTHDITNATNLASTNISTRNVVLNDGDTNTITLKAPADVTPSNYVLTLPATAGANGSVLSTDGTGILSWKIPSSGSVTSVTSANNYLSIANTTTTPLITANVGTVANTLAAGDDARIVGALQTTDYNSQVAPAALCTTSQTPYYSLVAGKWACQNINANSAGGFFKDGGNSFGATASLGTNDNFGMTLKTNNATRMSILSTGEVGIGISAPTAPLSVGSITTTSAAGTKYGMTSTITQSPTAASFSSIVGGNFDAVYSAAAGIDSSASLTGIRGTATQSNSGAMRLLIGGYFTADGANFGNSTTDSLFGVNATAGSVSGTRGNLYGGALQAFTMDGAVTNAYGLKANVTKGGTLNTVTNAYGVYSDIVGAGTITNSYGVFINSILGTNKWALYSADATSPSYFAGSVGIGVTAPATKLDVAGGIKIGTEASACAPALAGTLRYNAANFEYCNGVGWQAFGSAGGGFANGGNSYGAAATLGTNDNFALNFETNNSTKMTVLANGSVGIGTAAPAALLEVNGDITLSKGGARTIAVATETTAPGSDLTIQAGHTSQMGAAGGALILAAGNGRLLGGSGAGGDVTINSGTPSVNGTSGSITIETPSGNDIAVPPGAINITAGFNNGGGVGGSIYLNAGAGGVGFDGNIVLGNSTGNVGIGTTSTNSKLDLNGALTFEGMNVPALSPAGTAVMYFDNTGNKMRISENGGAYENLVSTSNISGTTGKIAKFSAANTVSNSIITETTGQISIAGQIISSGAANQTGAAPNINFNNGNALYVTSACTAFSLGNMVDGGSYMLTVKNTSGTCSFSSGTDAIHYAGAVSNVTITSHTIFSFLKQGSDVYVTWVTF